MAKWIEFSQMKRKEFKASSHSSRRASKTKDPDHFMKSGAPHATAKHAMSWDDGKFTTPLGTSFFSAEDTRNALARKSVANIRGAHRQWAARGCLEDLRFQVSGAPFPRPEAEAHIQSLHDVTLLACKTIVTEEKTPAPEQKHSMPPPPPAKIDAPCDDSHMGAHPPLVDSGSHAEKKWDGNPEYMILCARIPYDEEMDEKSLRDFLDGGVYLCGDLHLTQRIGQSWHRWVFFRFHEGEASSALERLNDTNGFGDFPVVVHVTKFETWPDTPEAFRRLEEHAEGCGFPHVFGEGADYEWRSTPCPGFYLSVSQPPTYNFVADFKGEASLGAGSADVNVQPPQKADAKWFLLDQGHVASSAAPKTKEEPKTKMNPEAKENSQAELEAADDHPEFDQWNPGLGGHGFGDTLEVGVPPGEEEGAYEDEFEMDNGPNPDEGKETASFESTFIDDITLPDYVEVKAGSTRVKTWRMRNCGTSAWDDSKVRVVQVDHDDNIILNACEGACIGEVMPGMDVDISVPVSFPLTPGEHQMTYCLATDSAVFGAVFWVVAIVVNEEDDDDEVKDSEAQYYETHAPGISDDEGAFGPAVNSSSYY